MAWDLTYYYRSTTENWRCNIILSPSSRSINRATGRVTLSITGSAFPLYIRLWSMGQCILRPTESPWATLLSGDILRGIWTAHKKQISLLVLPLQLKPACAGMRTRYSFKVNYTMNWMWFWRCKTSSIEFTYHVQWKEDAFNFIPVYFPAKRCSRKYRIKLCHERSWWSRCWEKIITLNLAWV